MTQTQNTNSKPFSHCSGCTDPNSEGVTHQRHTVEHPCPEEGDPDCVYCFPEILLIEQRFREEFGIHFQDSPDELEYAISFIEDAIKEREEKARRDERKH